MSHPLVQFPAVEQECSGSARASRAPAISCREQWDVFFYVWVALCFIEKSVSHQLEWMAKSHPDLWAAEQGCNSYRTSCCWVTWVKHKTFNISPVPAPVGTALGLFTPCCRARVGAWSCQWLYIPWIELTGSRWSAWYPTEESNHN